MATPLQTIANRRNAARSTGPRSVAGKVRSAANAIQHGLRSELPVLPGERVEDWQAHCKALVASLRPTGGLEIALAERIALILWRLRRLEIYETAVTALGMTHEPAAQPQPGPGACSDPQQPPPLPARLAAAEQHLREARALLARNGGGELLRKLPDLLGDAALNGSDVQDALQYLAATAWLEFDGQQVPSLEDAEWLIALGVPEVYAANPSQWSGWTARLVRMAWTQLATAAQTSPNKLLAQAVADWGEEEAKTRSRIQAMEAEVQDLRQQAQRQRQALLLLDGATLNKVMRYEGHLTRQLLQLLHTLERLQAARAGLPVQPPAVLDVTIETSQEMLPDRARAARR